MKNIVALSALEFNYIWEIWLEISDNLTLRHTGGSFMSGRCCKSQMLLSMGISQGIYYMFQLFLKFIVIFFFNNNWNINKNSSLITHLYDGDLIAWWVILLVYPSWNKILLLYVRIIYGIILRRVNKTSYEFFHSLWGRKLRSLWRGQSGPSWGMRCISRGPDSVEKTPLYMPHQRVIAPTPLPDFRISRIV